MATPPHCTYPWSNRDAFTYVSDCHIYRPLDLIFQSVVLFLAALCFTYGLSQSLRQPRKDLPLSSTLLGFSFLLSYSISLGLNISFADRNYGLNIIHGLARGSIWVVVNVFNVRHLEFIMSVDARTVAQSQGSTAILLKFNTGLCIFSVIIEVLIMLIPTADKSLRFYDFIGPITITLVVLNSTPRCVYAYQVRKLVISAQQVALDPEFYLPLKKQLESLITSTILGALGGIVIQLLCINLSVLYYNFYIAYTLQMVGGPYTGLMSLGKTVGVKGGSGHNAGTTRTEKPFGGHSSRKLATTTTDDEDEIKTGFSSTPHLPSSRSPSSQILIVTDVPSALVLEEKSISGVVVGLAGDIEGSLLQSSKIEAIQEEGGDKITMLPIFNPFKVEGESNNVTPDASASGVELASVN